MNFIGACTRNHALSVIIWSPVRTACHCQNKKNRIHVYYFNGLVLARRVQPYVVSFKVGPIGSS